MRRPGHRRLALRAATTVAAAGVLALGGTHAMTGTGTGTKAASVDLTDPHKKEIAMELIYSAENSSLNWKTQYSYIEDIGDGRGYTAGIIGFCSGTDDMLELVEAYTDTK